MLLFVGIISTAEDAKVRQEELPSTREECQRSRSGLEGDAEQLAHLCMEEAAAGLIRLYPLAVDDILGNRALADMPQYFFDGAWRGFDVDFGVRNPVLVEKALGFAAIAAPCRSVEQNLHGRHHTGPHASLAARYLFRRLNISWPVAQPPNVNTTLMVVSTATGSPLSRNGR